MDGGDRRGREGRRQTRERGKETEIQGGTKEEQTESKGKDPIRSKIIATVEATISMQC